jgi:hypothetical protein
VIVHASSSKTGARHRIGTWHSASRRLASLIAAAVEKDPGVSRMRRLN